MCRSTDRQSSAAEPEVWFHIVHITLDDQNTAYRKQTVEIALGPKRAFENGKIGSLTRHVPAGWIVSAVSRPARPKPPKVPRTPRGVKLLRKAIAWRTLLECGEAENQAEIARRESLTRARLTQVMSMLCLAAEIQEHVLSMPDMVRGPAITERALRPIANIEKRKEQLAAFSTLLDTTTESRHSRS